MEKEFEHIVHENGYEEWKDKNGNTIAHKGIKNTCRKEQSAINESKDLNQQLNKYIYSPFLDSRIEKCFEFDSQATFAKNEDINNTCNNDGLKNLNEVLNNKIERYIKIDSKNLNVKINDKWISYDTLVEFYKNNSWIPTSDKRRPESHKIVLLTLVRGDNYHTTFGYYRLEYDDWFISEAGCATDDKEHKSEVFENSAYVSAWMPFPGPMRDDEQETE